MVALIDGSIHQRKHEGTAMLRRLPGFDPQPLTFEIIDDPEYNAQVRAEFEQFERNSDWLQNHWSDLLPEARGKFVAVANQQGYVAMTAEEAWNWARENHPDDRAPLVQYVSKNTLPRIYSIAQCSRDAVFQTDAD